MAEYDPRLAASALASIVRSLANEANTSGESTSTRVDDALQTALGGMSGGVTSSPMGPGSSSPLVGDYSVSSAFGGARNHPGVDIAVPAGTSVHAAVSGRVTHASDDDPGGYGAWVEITAPDGTVTRYGHLSGINVAVGAMVSAGQMIGASGGAVGSRGAGNSTGAHLHFEVRRGGNAVDPMGLLGGAHVFGDSASLAGQIVPEADAPTVSTPEPPAAPEPVGDIQDVLYR